jgi:6-phosphogluconolactonase
MGEPGTKMAREARLVFADSAALAEALATAVASDLRESIASRGHALLAVSGGATPKKFLTLLGRQVLDWPRVTITLTDERWVPATQSRSNERLVRDTLLREHAAAAKFVSLYTDAADPESGLHTIAERIDALALPFDSVVLGLGTDGHCASLFAGGDHFEQALDPGGRERVLSMRSLAADEPRITLTLPVLAGSRALYLHIEGADKQRVFERVLAGEGTLAHSPLRAIMRAADVPLKVYWCA